MDEDLDNLDNFDVGSVVAEIGAELAGPEVETAEGVNDPVEAPAPVAETPAAAAETPAPVMGQNSEIRDLPKSWKKEMAPVWAKLPKEVHDYVYEREANVMRGFQQYQAGNESWQTLIKPFAPIFQQNPGVQPVQLMHGLMNTHLRLCDPATPVAQRAQLARQIFQDYGIPLDGLETTPDATQQELNALRAEISQIKSSWTQRQETERQTEVNKHVEIINAFASDPKNKYFNELGNDIHRLIQTGVAKDIATAYETACWMNPSVRAKLLAEQQAAQNPPKAPSAPKPGFVNVEADTTPRRRTPKAGNIDSTIDSIVASHFSKH